MAKAVIRYLRRAPTRLRKFWISWHHKNIYTARQIRQLARYETGITDVVDGDVSSRSGCYAAFVIFPVGRRIPENVLRAVRAMRSLGINVLACLNAPIDDDVLETLKPITHKVIFRNNIGFDFGAYKDCVTFLANGTADVKRFMLLNDSVYYSQKGLEGFFDGLKADFDVVAAFENWGDRTTNHLQSFAVSVSGYVFGSNEFQEFWARYRPVSSRLYAIEKGEKQLSEAILKRCRTSHVLYTCAQLAETLGKLNRQMFCDDIIVPLQYRHMLPVNGRRSFSLTNNYRSVIDVVNVTSPIHSGAWLFPRFMDAPIIKKDIVYRQRFQFWEVQLLFKDILSDQELSEFSTLVRSKGNYEKLDRIGLMRYELGIG